MVGSRYPFIAREAWVVLAVVFFISLILWTQSTPIFSLVTAGFFLLFLGLARDPYRPLPSEPLGVVSPVDGVVSLVEVNKDKRLDRRARRIQIKSRFYDVHSLRSPIEGKLSNQWVSELDLRQHFDFLICTDEGDNILTSCRLSRFLPWHRMYLSTGERLGHGQRCGYIYLGGRVDVFLPADSLVTVKPGDRVVSGGTVIGYLKHAAATKTIRNLEQRSGIELS